VLVCVPQVAKPDTVVEAEKGASGTDDENCAVIQAYQVSTRLCEIRGEAEGTSTWG
jgi:hypothetical protein